VAKTAPETIATLLALLFPFLFLAIASALYYRPRFKHDASTGTYINIKTGARACSICKDQDKIVSWLQTDPAGWWCNIHRRTFHDSTIPEEPKPQKNKTTRRTAY